MAVVDFYPSGKCVARSAASILLSLAVVLAFIEAPFLHTHRHESTQRHPGPVFHFHLKFVHATNGDPAFRDLDPDDDAQLQSSFSLTAANSPHITPAIASVLFSTPVLRQTGRTIEALFETGHDPPLLSLLNPRPPPA